MMAEQGTSIIAETISPARLHIIEMMIDAIIIGRKRCIDVSAIICGSEIMDIRSIMPTNLMVNTIQTATSTVMEYEMNLTGRPDTMAKSRSNAHAMILL